MAQVTLPFVFHNGDPNDADQVIADFNAILNQANGNLQAGANVKTSTPVAQNGTAQAEGSSDALLRSDATFIIRGVEQLATDPTTGNFVGRLYQNTNLSTLRYCTNATGTGTWITIGNMAASDLPNHASRHATGGPDPLPANSVDATMLAKRSIISATMSGDVTVTSGAWTDIITGVSVTTTGASGQLCHMILNVNWAAGSNAGNLEFRIQDDLGNTLYRVGPNGFAASGGSSGNDQEARCFSKYTTITGTRVLKAQALAGVSGLVVKQSMSVTGESGTSTQLQVVIG